jgi:hypothetical protein
LRGPWTATLNLNVILPGDALSQSLERFDFGINLSNPLGGLDELLHGSSNLKGWGAAPQPDPILYNVRGFDPAARRYQYSVNPRFGSTSPSSNTIRAPFRLTLDVTMDVGRSLIDQQLDRWLRPGRAGRSTPRLTYDQMTQRVQRNVPDPYAELLQQADSLLLTADQTRQLQAARFAYRMRVDSLWTGLAHYLVDLPDRYDFTAAAKHMDDVVGAVWEMTRLDVQEQYRRILAPEQLPILSGWSKQLFDAKRPLHVRLFQEG